MELTKYNTILVVNSFDRKKILELKEFLSDKRQCSSLKMMFRTIDRFLYFFSKGGSVCIYYDTNGFNGYTKENPYYLPNAYKIDFETFIKLNN